MSVQPLGGAEANAVGCDELTIEPRFDFEKVTVARCAAGPTDAHPDSTITVSANIRNDNSVPVYADIVHNQVREIRRPRGES